MAELIKHPYDFCFFMSCTNGVLNASADGTGPRIDMETGNGLVSDVAVKRKLRNAMAQLGGCRLYILNDASLNSKEAQILASAGLTAKSAKTPETDAALYAAACDMYPDIKFFGAALTSFSGGGFAAAQTTGAVTIGCGVSLDPILSQSVSITRIALTSDKEQQTKRNTIGQKYYVPYAVYRVDGSIDFARAQRNGFTEDDAELLWKCIMGMADIDLTASRPDWSVRDLFVFGHNSQYRSIPRHKLMSAVTARHGDPNLEVPRAYEDYVIELNDAMLGDAVTVRHFD